MKENMSTEKRYLFGTDGIRGKANRGPLSPESILRIAQAACLQFQRQHGQKHKVVIGKDTRLSGYIIEPAMTAGFISMGWDVVLLGPVPTPAVAGFTQSLRADLGVMISASHNPYDDNGIKFFGADGYKLSDEIEAEIEKLYFENDIDAFLPAPSDLGKAARLDDAIARYIEYTKGTFPRNLRLKGMKIVVDCAHGAAYKAAPQALWELGADVIEIGVDPDGKNINQGCGSTHLALLQETVIRERAHIGLALDGDADRLIVCDEKGQVIDGDQIMALIAADWKQRDMLTGDTIVTTSMSNMGLENYLQDIGLNLHRTAVGDRYVVEAMREKGLNFGGEQSGHLIMTDYSTTGDGLLAALQLLAVVAAQDKPVSEICHVFEPFPQILVNVRVADKNIDKDSNVQNAIASVEARLGKKGRVLVRKSGTEPLIRVMVEGQDLNQIRSFADEIADLIRVADTAAEQKGARKQDRTG